MYSRVCRICIEQFQTKSPYTLICSDACRDESNKRQQAKWKRSDKCKASELRYRQTEKAKIAKRKHLATPKAKATSSERMKRLVRDNKYYRDTKNLRQSKAYRDLRGKLIVQFGMCAACHSEHSLTVDHVIPMSIGGKHEIDNLQVLCRSCNSKKKQEIIRYAVPQVQQDIN